MKPMLLFNILAITLFTAACGILASNHAVAWEPGPHRHGPPDRGRHRDPEQEAIREAVKSGEVQPLPKILAIAQKAVPGDILEVELEYDSWGLKYELKILTASGQVRKVDVNAKTAAIVRIDDD